MLDISSPFFYIIIASVRGIKTILEEAAMNFRRFSSWLNDLISPELRLRNVMFWYLLYLMVSTRKHSLIGAAEFSGIHKSQFSRFLVNHVDIAVHTLEDLSKKQAKRISGAMTCLAKGAIPWKIALLIDSTLQNRSNLHADNVKRFNHGQGYVIGHQWTNIVLMINQMIVPLAPIPFHSKKYCREHGLDYKTENELVVDYINRLDLEAFIGKHKPKEVVVLADSGYDDKKIETAISARKWRFIIATKKTRSVKSQTVNSTTSKSNGWTHISMLFKNHRRVKWQTVRIVTDGPRRKRMDFRIRQIVGYLRYVGKVQLICSEFKKRPQGRQKFLACNDLKAKARQILIGYRIRWAIEIFHKEVKMFLGFQDVATKSFQSVSAHVQWVYCAYILLHAQPPGIPPSMVSMPEKQQAIKMIVDSKEKNRVIQLLTQINGTQRYKNELRAAMQGC